MTKKKIGIINFCEPREEDLVYWLFRIQDALRRCDEIMKALWKERMSKIEIPE